MIKTNFDREKPKNRCYISVIGYRPYPRELNSGFLEDLYFNPIRVENRTQQVPDLNGGLVDTIVKQPIWVEPSNEILSADKIEGLNMANLIISNWLSNRPLSPIPIILDIGCAFKDAEGSLKNNKCLLFGVSDEVPQRGTIYDDIPQEWRGGWIPNLFSTEGGVYNSNTIQTLLSGVFSRDHKF